MVIWSSAVGWFQKPQTSARPLTENLIGLSKTYENMEQLECINSNIMTNKQSVMIETAISTIHMACWSNTTWWLRDTSSEYNLRKSSKCGIFSCVSGEEKGLLYKCFNLRRNSIPSVKHHSQENLMLLPLASENVHFLETATFSLSSVLERKCYCLSACCLPRWHPNHKMTKDLTLACC